MLKNLRTDRTPKDGLLFDFDLEQKIREHTNNRDYRMNSRECISSGKNCHHPRAKRYYQFKEILCIAD